MEPAEVRRRIKEYAASGHDARVLWDDLTDHDLLAAMREISRVAGVLLADPHARARIRGPVAGGDDAFEVAAHVSGMGALLAHWVAELRLDVPPTVIGVLEANLRHGRLRAARLRRILHDVIVALRTAGVEPIVLKGMYTGAFYFPEPGTRPCADIDLLVGTDELDSVERVLSARGLRPSLALAERATWSDPNSDGPVSINLSHEDNPWSIDLHVSLDRRFPGAGRATTLGEFTREDLIVWQLDGESSLALAAPALIAHLAMHASDHLPRLSMVRIAELALVARRHSTEIDWTAFCDRFGRTGALPYLYPSLSLAESLLPGSIPSEVLERIARDVPARARHFADALEPATASQLFRGASFQDRFLWSRSLSDEVGVLKDLIWPRGLEGRRLAWRAVLDVMRFRWRRWRTGLLHVRSR